MFRLPFDIYPLLRPLLFRLDAERAHGWAIKCLEKGLLPAAKFKPDPILRTRLGDLDFPHPIGLAAGFDKQAEVIQESLDLGFAFVEAGGIAPKPQPGNPKPRLFRLPEAQGVINRFNFNSDGFDICLRRVKAWHDSTTREKQRGIVGINITKGDHCKDAAEAYILGLRQFAPYVSFVTVNVSCPNEPDARQLEGRDQLKNLLQQVKAAHEGLARKPLLLVKISPDQNEHQAKDIADVVIETGIDAMIVGNTTSTRPGLGSDPAAREKGGLSGKPLFKMSTALLGHMYRLTEGKIPLIGCGGVFTGSDAYAKIRAGASLVQLYTSLVYEGPAIIGRIAAELAVLLKRDGFASVADAVGADFRKS
jgi:dihydroorotate dehydrogenase